MCLSDNEHYCVLGDAQRNALYALAHTLTDEQLAAVLSVNDVVIKDSEAHEWLDALERQRHPRPDNYKDVVTRTGRSRRED